VDVLINNAGINLDNEYTLENARKTIDVNYHATLDVSGKYMRSFTSRKCQTQYSMPPAISPHLDCSPPKHALS